MPKPAKTYALTVVPAARPDAIGHARTLQEQAVAASFRAAQTALAPLYEAVAACEGLNGLSALPPGLRQRAERLASVIRDETTTIRQLLERGQPAERP